jgi:hypothetical protein
MRSVQGAIRIAERISFQSAHEDTIPETNIGPFQHP